MSKFTCGCGFCGSRDEFNEEWSEDYNGYERPFAVCPKCGASYTPESIFPDEYEDEFVDDCDDDFYDPEGAAERRMEAVMDYRYANGNLDAFYEDDAYCGGRW